jgi:hypothetical protein
MEKKSMGPDLWFVAWLAVAFIGGALLFAYLDTR